MPDLASILERESRSLEPPDGFERLKARRYRRRRNRRIGTAALALAVAAVGFSIVVLAFRGGERSVPADASVAPVAVCPSGSSPDEPGPVDQDRPLVSTLDFAGITFDRGSGRLLLAPGVGGSGIWAFDVCANTWQRMSTAGPRSFRYRSWETDELGALTYDVDSDLVVASGVGAVWAYDLDEDTWSRNGNDPMPFGGQPVYDPVSGLLFVFVSDASHSEMWTFDLDTDAWRQVDQRGEVPVAPAAQLLTYDASADRIVLYADACVDIIEDGSSVPCGRFRTFEFDPRSQTWSHVRTDTPDLAFPGWVPPRNLIAYDEANERTVIFVDGTIATYDATADDWEIVFEGHLAPADPDHAPIVYDPVNQRIVMVGELPVGGTQGGVRAFDLATGEWIQLLAPTEDTP